MADDIVTHLRDDESVFVDTNLLHEAADEIERLHEEINQLRRQVVALSIPKEHHAP